MTFSEYLADKKIDEAAFKQQEPARYEEWSRLFVQMHPDSFTAQKKFLINPIRRTYRLLKEES